MENLSISQVKQQLRAIKMSEVQISKFIEVYVSALDKNIPYPLYYAFSKTND
jgi:hypothetical protein